MNATEDVRVFLDTDRPEHYELFLKLKRLPSVRFYGCELKPEYHMVACKNLEKAEAEARESQRTLFDSVLTGES